VWTWVAIDADTKLVPSYLVGSRETVDAYRFMTD
jgi:transposase-like protein